MTWRQILAWTAFLLIAYPLGEWLALSWTAEIARHATR